MIAQMTASVSFQILYDFSLALRSNVCEARLFYATVIFLRQAGDEDL